MSSTEPKMAMAKTVLSTVGSIAATAMVARSVARDYLPPEIQDYFFFHIRNLFNRFSTQLTIVIDEFDGILNNEIYDATQVYLSSKISPNTRRLKLSKPEKENNINVSMDRNEEILDKYNGALFKWIWVCQKVQSKDFYNPHDMNSTFRSELRSFQLSCHRKHQEMAINTYFPYILKEAKARKQEDKTVKIFTVDTKNVYGHGPSWTSIVLDHPATFDTLAMDSEMKEMVLKDLERFVKRREYYRTVGKAWKRGYLLYGPPGTGKSSLIAAMANYLKFDIYDLELTDLRRNSELRQLLVGTANRSILVVEDIDCTVELQDRLAHKARAPQPGFYQEESKVTLSGLLNFTDGLWSSCGDERIIIFTTNHKEKLDPAMLRPGRMDLHIHMSYCTPCGFKLLAANYLGGIKKHELFEEIEELIRTTEVTPAEVAEQLLKGDEPDATLRGLIDFLHVKRKENEEAKARKPVETESVDEDKETDDKDKETDEKVENEVAN
ncbi:hypothetical protein RJ640_011166 [Escallonia rubra]|uniref:AAA+ ATPase domain-containing protein n=1 Tax=Escallonia rubra TaxID=112253 RepID=A0AA88URA2_9ASTE|nr:hypothetical protein RJ640_011166 [Escallonia rubra]